MLKKLTFASIIFLIAVNPLFSHGHKKDPDGLNIFRKSYPDLIFNSEYDPSINDWKITLVNNQKTYIFYWNNGSMIPLEELPNKENYWTLLYHYDYKKPPRDPSTFSDKEIENLRKFTSTENRKNEAGTPMFFFDAVYDSNTRSDLEKHIKKVNFLGFTVNVHERLITPLAKVDARIQQLAQTDSEVMNFVKSINKNEGYYWRIIAGTKRKSFHSLGIALDIQPKSYNGKEVFWSWTKDKNPENWMLTRISARWMPPKAVIDIFEEEGFIWGGKWTIWDNMHFEYHPELINFSL